MWPNPQFPADLVTFTEEIMNSTLYFLCSAYFSVIYALSFTLGTRDTVRQYMKIYGPIVLTMHLKWIKKLKKVYYNQDKKTT